MEEIEIWLPIPGYEEHYHVSNMGRVRSLSRDTQFGNNRKLVNERILKIKRRKKHYPFVILCKHNIQKTHMVHRLVGIVHVPNPNNYPEINHKFGDKNDSRAQSLEWTTRSKNQLHALDTGLMNTRKLTREQVIEIRKSTLTDIVLGKKYGVKQGNIWNVRNYKSWKHVP